MAKNKRLRQSVRNCRECGDQLYDDEHGLCSYCKDGTTHEADIKWWDELTDRNGDENGDI